MAEYTYSKILKEIKTKLEEEFEDEMSKIDFDKIAKNAIKKKGISLDLLANIDINILTDIIGEGITEALKRGDWKKKIRATELDVSDLLDLNQKEINNQIKEYYDKMIQAFDKGNEELAMRMQDGFMKAMTVAKQKGIGLLKKNAEEWLSEYDDLLTQTKSDYKLDTDSDIILNNKKGQAGLTESAKKYQRWLISISNQINAVKNIQKSVSGQKTENIDQYNKSFQKTKELFDDVGQTNVVKIFDGVSEQIYDVTKDTDALNQKLSEMAKILKDPVWQAGDLRHEVVNSPNFKFADSLAFNMQHGGGSAGSGHYTTSNFEDVVDWMVQKGQDKSKGLYTLDLSNYNLLQIPSDDYYDQITDLFSSMHKFLTNAAGLKQYDTKGINNPQEIFEKFKHNFEDLHITYEDFSSFMKSELSYLKQLDISKGLDQIEAIQNDFIKHFTKAQGLSASLANYDDSVSLGSVIYPDAFNKEHPYSIDWGGNIELARKFYDEIKQQQLELKASNLANDPEDLIRNRIPTNVDYDSYFASQKDLLNHLKEINQQAKEVDFQTINQGVLSINKAVQDGISDSLDSHSPSKEAAKQADNVVDGIINEVNNRLPEVKQTGENIGKAVVSGIKDGIEQAKKELTEEDYLAQMDAKLGYDVKFDTKKEDSLSDVGLTYDQLLKKIDLENVEIEKGNKEFKERIALLDEQNKVIASWWGDQTHVEVLPNEIANVQDAKKILHTHLKSGVFSEPDYNTFFETPINEFILRYKDSILKVTTSNLDNSAKETVKDIIGTFDQVLREQYNTQKISELSPAMQDKFVAFEQMFLSKILAQFGGAIEVSGNASKQASAMISDYEEAVVNKIMSDIIQDGISSYDYHDIISKAFQFDYNQIDVSTASIDQLIERFKVLRNESDKSIDQLSEMFDIYTKLGGTGIAPFQTHLLDEITDEQLNNLVNHTFSQVDKLSQELQQAGNQGEVATEKIIDKFEILLDFIKRFREATTDLNSGHSLSEAGFLANLSTGDFTKAFQDNTLGSDGISTELYQDVINQYGKAFDTLAHTHLSTKAAFSPQDLLTGYKDAFKQLIVFAQDEVSWFDMDKLKTQLNQAEISIEDFVRTFENIKLPDLLEQIFPDGNYDGESSEFQNAVKQALVDTLNSFNYYGINADEIYKTDSFDNFVNSVVAGNMQMMQSAKNSIQVLQQQEQVVISDKSSTSEGMVEVEQKLAEETEKANTVIEEQKQKIVELEGQVDDLRSSLKAQSDELAHVNEEYSNMMDELGRANDREDLISEELTNERLKREEIEEQNKALKEQNELLEQQRKEAKADAKFYEEMSHVAAGGEAEADAQRREAMDHLLAQEKISEQLKEQTLSQEKKISALEKERDYYEEAANNGEREIANLTEALDISRSANQYLETQSSMLKEQNEELQKKLEITEQITSELKEQNKKQESQEVTDIKDVQNAVKKKNKAFQNEESVVSKTVNNEITKLQELEKVISQNIPNAIQNKNEAFIGEGNVVSAVVNNEKKAIKQPTVKNTISNRAAIRAYQAQLEKFKSAIENPRNIITRSDREQYDHFAGIDISKESIENLQKYTSEMKDFVGAIEKMGNETKLRKILKDIAKTLNDNTAMPKELAEQYKLLESQTESLLNSGVFTPNQVQALNNQLLQLGANLEKTGKKGKSFFGMIGRDIKTSSARIIAQYLSIQDFIRYARSAVQAVTQLDNALTQLKIVSDASNESLKHISDSAYAMANALGLSTTEIVNSITEWRRLGYTIEDSQTLAQEAAKLSTGGLMDVNSATTSLISAMQAFKIGANEVGKVVDQYIYLGNNYAITSEQLATSLTKSMAALKVAGNSLEEIEALEIAGNTIVQDADSVSNSLKVLSMRLRGTTGSALEEIGEDTEGLIEDFSKLNNKIQNLTKTANDPKGVSIVDKMTGGYKSTYKILLEISKVWKDIGDMQKAELLEIMAGKVRATAAAAILESPELLERAFQDASENAVGAGARAIDASLSSIEKKTNKIKNNLQHFSQTLFDSEGVKNLLDAVIEFTASLDAEKFQPIVHTLETLLSILSKLLEIIPAEGVIGAIIGAKYIKNLSGLQGFIGRIFGSAVPAINQVTDATATLGTTTSATTAAVEAEGVAMQATTVKAVALRAAVGAIAAVLITSVISAINNLIHRQEQLNKELADSMRAMQKNTNAYEQEAKRIDQLVAKYNEYNTAIENNTLSGSALVEAQNSMRDVQKELNEAFGDGASKLDLINKKYQENSDIIKENIKLSREQFLADNASTYQRAKAQQNDSWLKEVLGSAGYLTLGQWQTIGKFTIDDRDKEEAERKLDADRIVKGLLKEYNFDIFNGDIDTFRASISSLIADYMSEKIDINSFADKYGTTQEYVTNVIQQIMQDWSAALEDENSQTNSAILGKDVVKQYDKYLLANDPEYYALYTELEGLVDGYQKAVNEQNREQIAEFGNKIYDFVVKTGPFNELPIEYGKFFSELFAKYTGTVVQFGPKEEQEALNEFLKYSDWLNAESNVKNGDKAYSNNALINAYKSSLDQLKDYIENDEEGKVEVNFGEIIRTTASDELFKSLGMDGFEEYIKKYGQEYTAIFAYINDAEKSLINNLDMNTQDKNILLTTLHDIKLEALGGADNVYKLRDSYKELKGETESDISRSMTKLTAGEKLTYQEMTKIINKYPDLRSAVIKYSNDSYSIQKENIDNLITEYAGLSNAAVSEMQEMYEATIHVAWAQIGLYRSVAETKKIYHDALETRGPLNNLFGKNTGKVIEAIKFLEELEGSWLPEDNDGDKGGNKDSKAQYDWLDSYLDKRNRALQKEETAYDRLTNKVIKKGDIETKYTQLQNQSLEEQNKLLDDQIAAYDEAEKEYGRRMKKGLLYNELVEAFDGSKNKADEIVQKIINREDINLLEYTSEQSSAITAMTDNFNKKLDAADKKLEAQNTKRENSLKMFTNNIEFITKKFDHALNEFAQRQSQLEHYQTMRTNSGMMENQKLYLALLDNESRELEANIQKRNELMTTLDTLKPKTEAEIDEWWNTKDAIDATTQAIWESEEAIESYKTSMQQLAWDLNDRIRDITGNIRNETSFLMDTLGTFEKDMYSYTREYLGNDVEKTKIYNGEMSDQGLVTLAMRRVNAKSYREDINRINKEIESIQELYLQNTADVDVLDRLNNLISERNNLIQSYNDEREAILSLVDEGYKKQLESLDAITSKYMEALQAEKD